MASGLRRSWLRSAMRSSAPGWRASRARDSRRKRSRRASRRSSRRSPSQAIAAAPMAAIAIATTACAPSPHRRADVEECDRDRRDAERAEGELSAPADGQERSEHDQEGRCLHRDDQRLAGRRQAQCQGGGERAPADEGDRDRLVAESAQLGRREDQAGDAREHQVAGRRRDARLERATTEISLESANARVSQAATRSRGRRRRTIAARVRRRLALSCGLSPPSIEGILIGDLAWSTLEPAWRSKEFRPVRCGSARASAAPPTPSERARSARKGRAWPSDAALMHRVIHRCKTRRVTFSRLLRLVRPGSGGRP
jgi:hypothetical protein